MKHGAPERNMSVLSLVLACLLYYLIASGFISSLQASRVPMHTGDSLYIEIVRDGYSTVHVMNNPSELEGMRSAYGVELGNGDRITVGDGEAVKAGRISGFKCMSLGVPIGINSAEAEDLAALPGIGAKLAARIIVYRDNAGGFSGLDELDMVLGIGKKKLEAIRGKISLD